MANSFHTFTLILAGVHEISPSFVDAIYEAGCDDALPGVQDGTVFLDFERESRSMSEAIRSAMHDVENAGVGASSAMPQSNDGCRSPISETGD